MPAVDDVCLYLHLLAMAFFVGGQLFLVAAVVPALRGSEDREPMRAIARRFGQGSLVALGVLVSPARRWRPKRPLGLDDPTRQARAGRGWRSRSS